MKETFPNPNVNLFDFALKSHTKRVIFDNYFYIKTMNS